MASIIASCFSPGAEAGGYIQASERLHQRDQLSCYCISVTLNGLLIALKRVFCGVCIEKGARSFREIYRVQQNKVAPKSFSLFSQQPFGILI